MKKTLLMALALGTLLFVGCSEKNMPKEELTKALVKTDDNYSIVINKSIKECGAYGIVLDEKRTNDFIRRSPKVTIDKAAGDTRKMPKKLCQFLQEETSLEKIESINAFTSKVINACEQLGVTLVEEKIHNRITKLPFFIIRKGLAMQGDTSVKECELMKKKYK